MVSRCCASSSRRSAGVGRLQELNLILNNLDRLEVRGRDSAGLSLLVVMQESHYTRFMKTLAHASLREAFAARTTGAVLDHRSITLTSSPRLKPGDSLNRRTTSRTETGVCFSRR